MLVRVFGDYYLLLLWISELEYEGLLRISYKVGEEGKGILVLRLVVVWWELNWEFIFLLFIIFIFIIVDD